MGDQPTLPKLGEKRDVRVTTKLVSRRVALPRSSSPIVSSDPPLFSSDDDPSIEKYSDATRNRQKQSFRGPWFRQQPVDSSASSHRPSKRRGGFERKFDSAVFMGSDGTEPDEDAAILDTISEKVFPLPGRLPERKQPALVFPQSTKKNSALDQEAVARKRIEEAVDEGKDVIDLSNLGLTTLQGRVFEPLRYFVQSASDLNVPTGQTLIPTFGIYMSTNRLRRIPGEIFRLDGLQILSARNNELVEIPQAVCKSTVEELNVANNNLRHLPYGILNLRRKSSPGLMQLISDLTRGPSDDLIQLFLHPNPFYEADESLYTPSPEDFQVPSGRTFSLLGPDRKSATYKYRSHVRFLTKEGGLVKGPRLPNDESLFTSSRTGVKNEKNSVPVAPIDDIPEPPVANASKSPSLLELCLKKWVSTPGMPDLETYLEFEPPAHLSRLCEDTVQLTEQERSFQSCTICARKFIIPRTEWVEWFDYGVGGPLRSTSAASPLRNMENRRDLAERTIPLIRRGCSWMCLPEKVDAGTLNV